MSTHILILKDDIQNFFSLFFYYENFKYYLYTICIGNIKLLQIEFFGGLFSILCSQKRIFQADTLKWCLVSSHCLAIIFYQFQFWSNSSVHNWQEKHNVMPMERLDDQDSSISEPLELQKSLRNSQCQLGQDRQTNCKKKF